MRIGIALALGLIEIGLSACSEDPRPYLQVEPPQKVTLDMAPERVVARQLGASVADRNSATGSR